ncbi:DUF4123 domain-containing protein [Paraherbaspirillum soli]|uniref:DUF4123 domain-containing protein n=1 Tax=Paraherbaspirillum soli TaxID=631222 RepID=A0ABW0M8V2_9BURK
MSMYYGVDPHHPDLIGLIETAAGKLSDERVRPDVIAMIDGCFDDDLALRFWKHSRQYEQVIVPLYAHSCLSGLEECAPFLLYLTRSNLLGFLKQSAGKPMLSILQSPLSLAGLQRHFAAFLQIRTPSDGLCMPLRFADTMCSEKVLAMFDDGQRAAFCSGFSAWHLINREGTLTTIAGTCVDLASYTPPVVAEANAIDITDKQYARLIDSGEAEYILCNLDEMAPHITTVHKASILYRVIVELLAGMDRRGIKNDLERRNLIRGALQMPDKFEVLALLDAAQKHGVEAALQRFA